MRASNDVRPGVEFDLGPGGDENNPKSIRRQLALAAGGKEVYVTSTTVNT